MTEANEPRFHTAKMLAERAGVSLSYVARLCRQGKIPAEKLGNVWIIENEDAANWLASRSEEPDSER